MGKYPNSEIHNKYSDFHYNLIGISDKYRRLYTSDIDRLWIEYDFSKKEIVGVLDIKWKDSVDSISATEKGIYEWFHNRGVQTFIVFINRDFTEFEVRTYENDIFSFNQIQYADFLLSLRSVYSYNLFVDNYNGFIDPNNSNKSYSQETLPF